MDNKEFDKYIKDQLDQQSSSDLGDWQSMHQRLIDEDILHSEISDKSFDDAVRQEVSTAKADFKSKHWEILRSKLLAEAYIKRRIAIVKGIELAMLLLFVWSVVSIVPFKNDLYPIHKYRPALTQMSKLFTNSYSKITNNVSYNRSKSVNPKLTPLQSNSSSLHFNGSWKFLPPVSPAKIGVKTESFTKSVPIAEVYIQTNQRNLFPKYALTDFRPKKPKTESILGISVGGAINTIEAPFTNSVGINPVAQKDINYQVDINYGIKQNKYELFTGVGFYNTSYKPSISPGVFDTYQGEEMPLSEIDGISYKFIHIPLGMRFHFIEEDNWSLFAMISTNFNLLADAQYDFRALTQEEVKLAQLNPQSFTSNNLRASLDSNLSQGLLQGAGFINSINTSASVGLGFINHFQNNAALFVQTSYTKSFSFYGIGAQDEKIDNLRLDLGVRVSL